MQRITTPTRRSFVSPISRPVSESPVSVPLLSPVSASLFASGTIAAASGSSDKKTKKNKKNNARKKLEISCDSSLTHTMDEQYLKAKQAEDVQDELRNNLVNKLLTLKLMMQAGPAENIFEKIHSQFLLECKILIDTLFSTNIATSALGAMTAAPNVNFDARVAANAYTYAMHRHIYKQNALIDLVIDAGNEDIIKHLAKKCLSLDGFDAKKLEYALKNKNLPAIPEARHLGLRSAYLNSLKEKFTDTNVICTYRDFKTALRAATVDNGQLDIIDLYFAVKGYSDALRIAFYDVTRITLMLTPLNYAIRHGNLCSIKKLLATGADPELLNDISQPISSLNYTLQNIHEKNLTSSEGVEIVQMLLAYGANVNSIQGLQDRDSGQVQQTALFRCFNMENELDIFKMILNAGANANITSYASDRYVYRQNNLLLITLIILYYRARNLSYIMPRLKLMLLNDNICFDSIHQADDSKLRLRSDSNSLHTEALTLIENREKKLPRFTKIAAAECTSRLFYLPRDIQNMVAIYAFPERDPEMSKSLNTFRHF